MEDSQFGQTTFDYDTYNAIYDKAISIISMATQSEKNLRDKLAKHRYPQEMLDAVINELKESGYIDDARNPMTYATNLYMYKHYGYIKVLQKLQQRGIDRQLSSEAARTALEECGGEEEIAKMFLESNPEIAQLCQTKDQADKKKFYNKMAARGFSSGTISRVCRLEYFD